MPARSEPMSRGEGLSTRIPMSRPREKPAAARGRAVGAATGLPKLPGEFTAKVKLQIRTRAGNGDPSQALCEAHGDFLGLHGGEIQHIVARGMGGSRDPVKQSPANGALLCREAHMLCEARDRDMLGMGFWLPQGTDPRLEPMMLHGRDGGLLVWRSTDGQYLTEPPEVSAA